MKTYRVLILAALLLLPACAQNLQNQIDEQGKAITILQRKNQELDRLMRRLRDDYQSDMDRLRLEMKSVRTSVEAAPRHGEAETQGPDAAGQQTGSADGIPAAGQARPVAPTDKDQYNQAYGLYTGGDYGRSRKMFNELIAAYPGSPMVSSALYWVASSYFKEGKFEESISACDDVIKKFPQGNKTADAYYLQALAFCEIKDPTTAQIILEDLIQKYPDSEATRLGKQKYDELKK